jgi:hypothetical protein
MIYFRYLKSTHLYSSKLRFSLTIEDTMSDLIHIRVGKELKKQMEELIESGLYSNQAEIAREGIRQILLKYKK